MRTLPLRIAALAALVAAISVIEGRAQVPSAPIMWFRADSGIVRTGDTVLQWRNVGTAGGAAQPTAQNLRPLYAPNGMGARPAVHFEGRGQFLQCPSAFPTNRDYTKIVVARFADYSAVNNILSSGSVHAFWLGATKYPKMFHSGTFVDSYTPVRDNGNILMAQFEHAALEGTVFVNGSFGARGVTTVANTDNTLLIGSHAGGYVMNGHVAEALIYDRLLTRAEREAVEDYLSAKYSIPLDRPDTQRVFSSFPAHYQFYARDANDSAAMPIAGTVRARGFDSIRVDVYRDGGFWKSAAQPLLYTAGGAAFALAPTIYARPVFFGVRVVLVRRGVDSLIASRDSIICGDVILITGQSNSTPGDASATYSNPFCRSFGTNTGYTRYDGSDTLFGASTATSGGYSGRWHAGIWGLRLQQLMLERMSLPTCLVNGGVGGSSIEINLRNEASPLDPNSIYGRTLYRMRKSGLHGKVRYMFWYQGESNGIENYYNNFKALHAAWRQDYPALERSYVIQIRPGCAQNVTHGDLRELQRTLGDSLPGITAFAPTGVPGHDGCHYSPAGYRVLAEQLYRLVARDFYGSDDTIEVESPNIRRAWYSTAARDEITLRFQDDQRMVWPADSVIGDVLRVMKDQFFLDDSVGAVLDGRAEGATIKLRLKAPSAATRITYVPPVAYAGTTYIYEGPWLANSRGVGAFTFKDVPIRTSASGVDIDPDAPAPKIAIVPNPADRSATLTIGIERRTDAALEIVDVAGRVLSTRPLGVLEPGRHVVTIETGALAPGVYRCVIRQDAATAHAALHIAR